jgi:hypothetical protein
MCPRSMHCISSMNHGLGRYTTHLGHGGPRGSSVRLLVDDHANVRRRNGCSIEIKISVHLGPGREFWIQAQAMQEVETEESLRK